ncbi:hypothetical protein Peur_057939 [Populus x canadensis]
MSNYKIRRIDVDFPFETDDCQLVYMEKNHTVSPKRKCNALLESPAATGKTPCLLCASLAWRKSLGGFSTGKIKGMVGLRVVNRILPKMVIFGSREQLCVHEEVSLLRGKVQNNTCHLICRKREKYQCSHYSRVEVKPNPHLVDEPVDIEDLVDIGRTFEPCPYISRELHKVVDLLFAPYNYLIDRGNEKSLTIVWDNNRLIFDEENLCADAASFDLPSGLLTACIFEAKSCIVLSNPDNFAILRAFLLKLEKRIAEVSIESKELGFTKPGSYIYELFADLNIANDTATKTIVII